MNIIEVRAKIAATPSTVWAFLGDFGGVAAWNPFVVSAEISGEGVGMTRAITAAGGARIVERLESIAAGERHLRYSVLLESGVISTADIRLDQDDAGETVIVWQSIRESDLTPDQQDAIASTLRSRIDALAQAVAAA